MAKQLPVCKKCGGSGNIEQFNHVMAGQCFRCLGSGRAHNPPEPKPEPRVPDTPWPYRELILIGKRWRIYQVPGRSSWKFLAVPQPLWPKDPVGSEYYKNPDEGWYFGVENGKIDGDMESATTSTAEAILKMHPDLIPAQDLGDWEAYPRSKSWNAWHRFLVRFRDNLQNALRLPKPEDKAKKNPRRETQLRYVGAIELDEHLTSLANANWPEFEHWLQDHAGRIGSYRATFDLTTMPVRGKQARVVLVSVPAAVIGSVSGSRAAVQRHARFQNWLHQLGENLRPKGLRGTLLDARHNPHRRRR